jgi:hypothetical protein
MVSSDIAGYPQVEDRAGVNDAGEDEQGLEH